MDALDQNAPQSWKKIVARYQVPSAAKGIWQIVSTFVPYIAVWCGLYYALQISYWLAVPLTLLGAGFLVRIFIIFHDCTHNSFFKSKSANEVLGFVAGVLSLTPFHHWKWEHALHHASSGDLDRRGVGDVWTMTVQEYIAATRWKRFAYRLARNPIILFFIAPFWLFLVQNRFAKSAAGPRERLSVHLTNLSLAVVILGMSLVFGWKTFLLLQVSIMMIAGCVGIWLFYVQHQFEGVYWERNDSWDYCEAALKGSSFYKLPKVLQWFSGNIGFHHIHHLSPRIPNYNLEKCHKAEPLFQTVKPVTFFSSFKSLRFRLWDEESRRLVGYEVLKKFRNRGRDPRQTA